MKFRDLAAQNTRMIRRLVRVGACNAAATQIKKKRNFLTKRSITLLRAAVRRCKVRR